MSNLTNQSLGAQIPTSAISGLGDAATKNTGSAAGTVCAGNDSRLSDSRAPSGAAGGQLTGTFPNPSVATGILGGVAWTTVTKASDESVTSNATLSTNPDDELFFTAASGGMYEFEAYIVYASPIGAGTPDLLVGFGEDGTVRGWHSNGGFNTADSANLNGSVACVNNNGTSRGTAAANRSCLLFGIYWGSGAQTGIYWVQNTSSVNATTVRAGSLLRYRRIV